MGARPPSLDAAASRALPGSPPPYSAVAAAFGRRPRRPPGTRRSTPPNLGTRLLTASTSPPPVWMGHSPERFPPRHRPRSSGPGRGPTLALPPPGRRAGAEALGPQGTSRRSPPRAPPGVPRPLRGTAPLRERRQRPRPSSARCAGGLRAKRPAEVAGTNRFARGFEPLGRGAVTGVHETDTLLCATKTCSHVCAASAPASVWFSCCTAHRTNV